MITFVRFVIAASVIAFSGATTARASAQATRPANPDNQGALPLDENAAFARARSFYEANDYSACVATFSSLLNASNPDRFTKPAVIEQARIYYAACLIGVGKVREADEQMRLAIRANPLLNPPDPLVFPGAVVDRFFGVRSQLLTEIRRAEELRVQQLQQEAEKSKAKDLALRKRIEELERLAVTESLVQKNSRWIASVPFGVGQFQNRNVELGWLFLTTETLLAGTAITAVSVELGLNAQANGGNTTKDTGEINRRLRVAHAVEIGATAGFLVVATLGIIEANLSFVPEFRLGERRRRLERAPQQKGVSVKPIAAPLSEGALLGVSGKF